MKRLSALSAAFSLVLSGCGPGAAPINPVQTAMAATLAARPPASPAPLFTATPDRDAPLSGKIAYVCQYSKRSGRNQICLINADGNDQSVLTPGAPMTTFSPQSHRMDPPWFSHRTAPAAIKSLRSTWQLIKLVN